MNILMTRATARRQAPDRAEQEAVKAEVLLRGVTAALAAIATGGTFATEVRLSAGGLRLAVEGVGPLRSPISAAVAKQLIAVARPAPFGRGERTVYDRSVRDTWEIEARRIEIEEPRWQHALAPALETIRERLGLPEGVRLAAKLDKMLVYGPGQFFAPHQDSERSDDMVGSLVVELPSRHEGGEFVVRHDQENKTFGGAATKDITLLAFYADCHHEARPVRSGHRIILTYHLLRRGKAKGEATVRPVDVDRLQAGVETYFATPVMHRYERSAPRRPDRLIYLLDHEYTEKGLSWEHLKGADRLRVAALREVTARLDCEVYLALAEVHETWSADEDSRGWYDDDEETGDVDGYSLTDLIDDDISLEHFVDPDGRAAPDLRIEPDRDEICFTRASVDMSPFKSEYEGYMGNYGNTMERWYRRAALVMWPRARDFTIRAAMSPSWAVEQLAALVKAGSLADARARADELVPDWDPVARREGGAAFVSNVLKVLVSLEDARLSLALLSPLEPARLSPRSMLTFAALVERHGLAWAKELFSVWTQAERYDAPPWLSLLPQLCQVLAVGPQGRALAEWLVSREVDAYMQRRARHGKLSRVLAEEQASGDLDALSKMFEAAGVIRASVSRDELVAFLIAPETALPLASAGALLMRVEDGRTPEMVRTLGLHRLYRHVVDSIERSLAAPERDPGDWSIEPPVSCACVLCEELSAFLRARERIRHPWPLAKDARRHVHGILDHNRLPVSHKTIRQGRPYTLVLTKTNELFKRDKAERARQRELLVWLKRQQGAFSPSSVKGRVTDAKTGRSIA